jgi:16S rRNA (cytosine967-C5)-methyltransferase
MKTDKPRQLALMILNGQGQGTAIAQEELFRQYNIDERDRAFVNNLVQGVLRWRQRLDWVVEQFSAVPLRKIDEGILIILRLAVFQILFLDRVPESAAVNEAVNLARSETKRPHVSSFVNGLLRTVCRQKAEIKFPDREKDCLRYLSIYYSYPQWLVDKWSRELGDEFTETLLAAQNNFPDLNIRANTLRISRDDLIETLNREGVNSKPLAFSPDGLRLEGFRGRVDLLEAFKKGLFQVQDQAAQIASRLLQVEPGDEVLDICSGLGGKATHLAQLMEGRGHVVCLDNSRDRLDKSVENAARLGLEKITTINGDALKLPSLLGRRFRRILLDAPCSGLGVISRHPDIKWNRKAEDIGRLAAMQKAFINAAASVLEKGGELLYVVCTISREENEGVVKDLLERNSDISLVNLKERVPEWCFDLIDDKGFYRTYPQIHGMDGFFAALFKRGETHEKNSTVDTIG